MAKCRVSYRDSEGVEHAVEVMADSLFEAAALGLEAFATAELTENRPGVGTVLEVAVRPPPVVHRVRVQQVKKWLNGAVRSPRERLLKERLRGRVGE